MDAPECPFCHKKEWRHVCASAIDKFPGVKKIIAVETLAGIKEQVIEKPKVAFDRKKYQREYMRAYRARKG